MGDRKRKRVKDRGGREEDEKRGWRGTDRHTTETDRQREGERAGV